MTSARRSVIALVLMGVALIALVLDGVNNGWGTFGVLGVGCFVLAIIAQLVVLHNAGSHR